MIYITGDMHGDFSRLSTKNFPEQKKMCRDDCVICTGDFGGVWDDSPREKYWLDWLEEKPFTTLFIAGNHENYAMLNAMQVEEWRGGKIHRVRDHVIHLMSGQIFHLDDMTFFTMGGAASHDIEDGVLKLTDPDFERRYRQLRMTGARFRILGVSWWPEEMPSDEEYAEAERNLDKAGWNVDIILTHCAPTSIAVQMDRHYEPDRLTDFLQMVKRRCRFDYWFAGHYHRELVVEDKFFIQYHQISRIDPLDNEETDNR